MSASAVATPVEQQQLPPQPSTPNSTNNNQTSSAVNSAGATTALVDSVKLISSDGFEFIVDRKCAMASGTIKNILSSPGRFTESIQNEVNFREIRGAVLDKVCQYLYYQVRYTNSNSTIDIPEFQLEPSLALDVLMTADFLDI